MQYVIWVASGISLCIASSEGGDSRYVIINHNYGPSVLNITSAPIAHQITQHAAPIDMQHVATHMPIGVAGVVTVSWSSWIKTAVANRVLGCRTRMKTTGAQIWSGLWRHKWLFCLQVLFCLYLYSNYRLFKMGTYMRASKRLVQWDALMHSAQRCTMSPAEIVTSLTSHMQESSSELSLTVPDMQWACMRALDEEERVVRNYMWWVQWITIADSFCTRTALFWSELCAASFGIMGGSIVRAVLGIIRVRSLLSIDDELVLQMPEYLARLRNLRKLIAQP